MTRESLANELTEASLERLDKDIKTLIMPSRLKWWGIFSVGFIIAIISSSHGIDEGWAREVATALITVDGLVFGFAVLGMEVFSSRTFTRKAYERMIEESAGELTQALGQQDQEKLVPEEFIKKELLPLAARPTLQLGLLRLLFKYSVYLLLASIGSAFCLFGVSNTTTNNPFANLFFFSIYWFAISFFILGAYVIINGLSILLEKGASFPLEKTFKLVLHALEKRAKVSEKRKEKQE